MAVPAGQDSAETRTAARLATRVPAPLRPPMRWIARRGAGRILVRTLAGLVRIQIFDRAMTLAAQAFTSLFPILIMVGAVFGPDLVARVASLAELPASSRHLIDETLTDRGLGAFGVAGILVVLLSSTGLARALARAYATVWQVSRPPSGPRAAWRWLLAVLVVAALLVGTRLSGWLTADLPRPRLWSGGLLLAADCAVAVLLPGLLLSRAVPVRMLAPGGLAFAVLMLAVRPAGAVYLPRALQTSYDRYGTIGLAFTYIGWLYIMAFCLLATAVLGQVLAQDEGVAGRLIRGGGRPGWIPAVLRRRYWLRLAAGVLAIGLGATAFAWPSATVRVVGVLFGINLLVTGAVRGVLLVFVPGYPPRYRSFGVVSCALTAVSGVVCLRHLTASVVLLVVVVATGWMLEELVQLLFAEGGAGAAGTPWHVVTGLALLLAAFAVPVWPRVGLAPLAATAASILLAAGIGQVAGAIAGLRAARRAPA